MRRGCWLGARWAFPLCAALLVACRGAVPSDPVPPSGRLPTTVTSTPLCEASDPAQVVAPQRIALLTSTQLMNMIRLVSDDVLVSDNVAQVIIDGGFNRATDVLKAIALGATAVGIGRLYCYALAAAGQPGIVRMLELLEDEMKRDLGLMGCVSMKKLDKSYVCKMTPVKSADVFSAYPLGGYSHDPY